MGDLYHAALEEFEEFLGVLLLLLGGLEEDGGYLLVAFFLGYACEVGVAAAGLGLTCE